MRFINTKGYDSHALVFVKRPVASCTEMDTGTEIILFTWHLETFVPATCTDEHGPSAVLLTSTCADTVVVIMSVKSRDLLRLQQLHPPPLSLLTKTFGKTRCPRSLLETRGRFLSFLLQRLVRRRPLVQSPGRQSLPDLHKRTQSDLQARLLG